MSSGSTGGAGDDDVLVKRVERPALLDVNLAPGKDMLSVQFTPEH